MDNWNITKNPVELMDKLAYFQSQLSYLQKTAIEAQALYEEQKLTIDFIDSEARKILLMQSKDMTDKKLENYIKSNLITQEVEICGKSTNLYNERKLLIENKKQWERAERLVKTCLSAIDVCRSMLSYFREESRNV